MSAAKPQRRDAFSLRLLIINELTRAGGPLTSRQLADRLNGSLRTVSAACSRLATYGQLDKVMCVEACRAGGLPNKFYLWSLPK